MLLGQTKQARLERVSGPVVRELKVAADEIKDRTGFDGFPIDNEQYLYFLHSFN